MRLEAFRFRNLGPFGSQGVAVEGLRGGLNVVTEANERGKSSLLSGLELLLFKPHTSLDAQVRMLSHGEDGAAEGEIDFVHAGRAYRLSKRFRSGRTATLSDRDTGAVIATRGEAEERLAEFLGTRGRAHGPSGLLWVRQGTSMEGIRDDGHVAARLEGELSTLVGGERARDIFAQTVQALSALRTDTGRPRKGGALQQAGDALDAARVELERALSAARDTRQTGRELASTRTRLAQLENEADPAEALAEARMTLSASEKAQSVESAARADAQRMAAEAQAARNRLEGFLARCAERDQLDREVDRLDAALRELNTARDAGRARLADATNAVLALQEQQLRLRAAEDARRLRERIADRNGALQALLQAYDQARDAAASRDRLAEALDALPRIDTDTLNTLARLEREVDAAEARLATLEVGLQLTLEPGARAALDGEDLPTGPVTLRPGSVLALPGAGMLSLDMPEAAAREAERDTARRRALDAYARLEVADFAAAADAQRVRAELQDELDLAQRELDRAAPDGLDALESRRDTLEADMAALTDRLEALGPVDAEAAGEADAAEAWAEANGARDAAQSALSDIERELARQQEALRGARRNVSALSDVAPDRRVEAQAQLAAASATAEARAEDAQAQLHRLQAQAPTDPAMARARVERLEAFARNRQKERVELLTKQARLDEERRATLEKRDPDAEALRLSERVARLEAECAQHERRADALTLLRDTLQDSQRQLRERYTAPVRRELLPLLRQVIDGADLALSEDLGATALLRGDVSDALERLSGGTQEQIAVLTRLAFARLLARGGEPTPVILDDALVYADDARRARMFDVLNYVTSGDDPLQLLYLSCHASATAALGGHRLELAAWPGATG